MLKFRSHKQASEYLKYSIKMTRKQEGILYEIDKTIPNLQTVWKICKVCGKSTPSTKNRKGYCNDCSKKGLGNKNSATERGKRRTKWVTCKECKKVEKSSQCRHGWCKKCSKKGIGIKNTGKHLSIIFKGKGNPNYVHGQTKHSLLLRRNQWFLWGRFILHDSNYRCVLSGRTDDLQCHHIIPFSICEKLRFEKFNGVVLNRFYHIELHRLQLDLRLLANLSSSVRDVLELREWFARQHAIQSLLQLPYQIHDQHELVRIAGRNQNRQLQLPHLLPEFDPSSLNRLAFQS